MLAPQACEFLALLCCQCAGGSIAGVDLGKAHPFAQCGVADVEIGRDATDRAIPDLAEPNSLCFELGREGTTWALGPFRCFVHDTLLASILANLGVHEIGGGSASISGNVKVGLGVEIGTSAAIRQGISLANGCGIGMGSIVVKDVPANTLVVGNPAKPLRELEPW